MSIPEPDLNLLTTFERHIFGSKIRLQYLAEAASDQETMKRELYYNGMKYTIRKYALSRLLKPFLLTMICTFAIMVIAFSRILTENVIVPLALAGIAFYCLFALVLTVILLFQYRTQTSHRRQYGIPLDRRNRIQRSKTPGQYF